MQYFSDREGGTKGATVNYIDVIVWNGIVAIIDSFIADNSFSKDFPEQCPDNLGVYRCNTNKFYDKLKALVPEIEVPLKSKEKVSYSSSWEDFNPVQVATEIDTYACLDLIEFCYSHLSDAVATGKLHEFFNHYHLFFKDTGKSKERFREEINTLFVRNRISYFLDENGQIVRIVSDELKTVIKTQYRTGDDTLNGLLEEAVRHILMPKINDRLRALEKAWDAFERAKTYYSGNKNMSSTQLINLVSRGNSLLEAYLTSDAKVLTEIGNKFQIRHFETDKQPINDTAHIDYLFHRIFALINLFVTELEK